MYLLFQVFQDLGTEVEVFTKCVFVVSGVPGPGHGGADGRVRGLQCLSVRIRPDGHRQDLHHDGTPGKQVGARWEQVDNVGSVQAAANTFSSIQLAAMAEALMTNWT